MHPLGVDGDFTLRQNTLAALDDRAKVILPMQFATIVRDKRLGVLTYRHYAVASGEVQAREDETALAKEAIVAALGAEENRAAVEADSCGADDRARRAERDPRRPSSTPPATTMRRASTGSPRRSGEIAELIEKGVPEARHGARRGPGDRQRPIAAAGDGASNGAGRRPAAGDLAQDAEITCRRCRGQQEAAAALLVAEDYFSAAEPSAPALILVRQARLLIGKPLVAALEALAPQTAEKAVIRFDGPFKFQIDMNRMRLLSGEARRKRSESGPSRRRSRRSRSPRAAMRPRCSPASSAISGRPNRRRRCRCCSPRRGAS